MRRVDKTAIKTISIGFIIFFLTPLLIWIFYPKAFKRSDEISSSSLFKDEFNLLIKKTSYQRGEAFVELSNGKLYYFEFNDSLMVSNRYETSFFRNQHNNDSILKTKNTNHFEIVSKKKIKNIIYFK